MKLSKEQFYTNTIEQKGLIENIRFVPNIHDINKSTISINVKYENHIMKKYFSYIFKDDKIVPYQYGEIVKRFIGSCFNGYHGTPDGQIIKIIDENDPSVWYSNINGTPEDEPYEFGNLKEGIIKMNDAVEYDCINLFDITHDVSMLFDIDVVKVSENTSFMKIHKIRRNKFKTIYQEGQSKEDFIKLYDDVPKLEDVAKKYVDELIKKDSKFQLIQRKTSIFD